MKTVCGVDPASLLGKRVYFNRSRDSEYPAEIVEGEVVGIYADGSNFKPNKKFKINAKSSCSDKYKNYYKDSSEIFLEKPPTKLEAFSSTTGLIIWRIEGTRPRDSAKFEKIFSRIPVLDISLMSDRGLVTLNVDQLKSLLNPSLQPVEDCFDSFNP